MANLTLFILTVYIFISLTLFCFGSIHFLNKEKFKLTLLSILFPAYPIGYFGTKILNYDLTKIGGKNV